MGADCCPPSFLEVVESDPVLVVDSAAATGSFLEPDFDTDFDADLVLFSFFSAVARRGFLPGPRRKYHPPPAPPTAKTARRRTKGKRFQNGGGADRIGSSESSSRSYRFAGRRWAPSGWSP